MSEGKGAITTDVSTTPVSSPGTSWTSAAKVAAAVGITGGGLLLHFIGATSHRVYLQALRLDPGLFPKTTDWIVISGYYTLIDRIAVMLKLISDNWLATVLGVFGLCVYLFVVRVLSQYVEKKLSGKIHPKWLKSWRGDLLESVLISCLVYLSVPLALLFLMVLMIPPAALAETAGLDSARRDLALFKNGCVNATPISGCLALRKGAELMAYGFLVDSTDSHIAIFDVGQQRARAFERAGTELVGDYPSSLEQSATVSTKN